MADSPANLLRSPAALESLYDHLREEFDVGTRKRGLGYLRNGAITELWEDENTVAGHVQGSEPDPYTATLTYEDDIWDSECECPVGHNCKHTYAVGQSWLNKALTEISSIKAPAKAPAPARPSKPAKPATRKFSFRETWTPILAEKIGRPLTAEEGELLGKLSALFQEFRQHGSLTQHALQTSGLAAKRTLHDHNYWQPAFPDWWSRDDPPTDPWQLWQYLAFDWDRQGRPLPEAFVPLTDLLTVRERLGQKLIAEEVAVWRRALPSLGSAPTAPGAPRPSSILADTFSEARVKLTSAGHAQLQVRANPAKPWRVPTQTWMRDIPRASYRDLNAYAEPARSLLTSLHLIGISFGYGTSREGMLDPSVVQQLLQHDASRAAFVLPDESPWQVEDTPLSFQARPRPDDDHHLEVQITLPDGTPLPPGAEPFIQAPNPLYLIENRVWVGPSRLPSARLPVAALSDPGVATALQSLGLRLPAELTARITPVALSPLLRLSLETIPSYGYGSGPSERLHVQLFARATEPKVAQHFSGHGGWQWVRDAAPPPAGPKNPHYQFDLTAANAVAATFGSLQLQYLYEEACWSRQVTADFPDKLTTWHASLPPNVAIEATQDLAGLMLDPLRARLHVGINQHAASGQDWFDVSLQLQTADLTLTDEEMKLLLKARGGWVRLPRRGYQRLQVEEHDPAAHAALEKLGLTADPADLLATRDQRETHRFHALQLATVDFADADLTTRLRQRVADLHALPPPPPPDGLSASLRPYQQEGFHYLAHLSAQGLGGVLADDMGLGKTVQALAWLLWLRDRRAAENPAAPFRVLVVCPKSVVPNWQNETARFASSLPVTRLAPLESIAEASGLLVLNYTQLRLRAENLAAVTWDAVVLDEGQNIKTPTSATARAARDLPALHRVVLTGTPIENRLLDLWSLLAFAQPGLLGTQASFQRLYNDKRDPEGARSRLATRVRPFLLRRTKQQVARDLPDRTEEDVICELEGPQRTLYDAELKRARQLLLKVENTRQFDAARFNILQSLLRLRQICCDPRLIAPDDSKKPSSAKLEALLETVESLVAEGHRLLVFSQFVGMLELIREELAARQIGHLLLTGQTENRQELVDQFQAPDGPPVFLLSLKAAGSGLNLTAASYVVLYDPWWNPAVEAQAIDRTHRIGQTANVIAYRLIAKDTIEEKIRLMQREKAALAAAVVQEESLTKVMDLDTLRQILG